LLRPQTKAPYVVLPVDTWLKFRLLPREFAFPCYIRNRMRNLVKSVACRNVRSKHFIKLFMCLVKPHATISHAETAVKLGAFINMTLCEWVLFLTYRPLYCQGLERYGRWVLELVWTLGGRETFLRSCIISTDLTKPELRPCI
jgi:hypothetical protein